MRINELKLKTEKLYSVVEKLYGKNSDEKNVDRYLQVTNAYVREFGNQNFELFSAPGRTEIIGNHTDHNHGKVLAGSIDMDCIAAVGLNNTSKIHIISATYSQNMIIDINNLPRPEEVRGTVALIIGILKGFLENGYKIGGFNMYTTSNVIGAAGVSSSASFEMLLCRVLDFFFNNDRLNPTLYALAGKYAENVYWGKNSGLLDQMACAVGGGVFLDFKNSLNPDVEKVNIDFEKFGYDLLLVNTGKNHADLSEEYSSIPNEMKKVAEYFGKETLRDVTFEELIQHGKKIRKSASDRAFLRAIHYFEENERVDRALEAVNNSDIDTLLKIISESGNSSWKYLQNCALSGTEQPVAVALALVENYIKMLGAGACRVHGGGFAGVIMCIIPCADSSEFIKYMEDNLEINCVYPIKIREEGAFHLVL